MLTKTKNQGLFHTSAAMFFSDNLMIVAIQDASYAVDVAPRLAGLHEGDAWSALPVALEWRSTVIRRVCRSSLQAESLPLLLGTNEADFYGLHFAQWQGKMDATIWVVKAQDFTAVMWARDCFSLLVHLLNPAAGSVTDTRLAEIWRQGGERSGGPTLAKMPHQSSRVQAFGGRRQTA